MHSDFVFCACPDGVSCVDSFDLVKVPCPDIS